MSDNLADYLNDHLAGSEFALGLLDLLREQNPGKPLAAFALEMLTQIREDKTFLQGIIDRAGVAPSAIKQAASWLGSKLSELKFTPDAFGTFRALETLALGIDGKAILWQTLASLSTTDPRLTGLSLDNMVARAKSQRQQIETQRILMAQAAFSPLAAPVTPA